MKYLLVIFNLLIVNSLFAQEAQTKEQKEATYLKTINDRAAKIVKTLALPDSAKALKVQKIIAEQYRNLNTIHEAKKVRVAEIRADKSRSKALVDSLLKIEDSNTDKALAKLHKSYVRQLGKKLTSEQVEGVKNGMTYSVFPNTYKAYQEMMPNLTTEQKKQIFDYLFEAREHAMDAESSEKKHAWFGKYKGRINNYLSAQGIDMKKMSSEWEARIRAKESHK